MLGDAPSAEILRLYHVEKWRVGTIARHLGCHHSAVVRVLEQDGVTHVRTVVRTSAIEPYVPLIIQTLEKFPDLCASRLYQMVKERGYPGGEDYFRHQVCRYRPKRKAEAFLRLTTLPGEEGQVDWGHFGKLQIGKANRNLMGFVMVLSFSRQVFLRFFLGAQMPNFLAGHVEGFTYFGGVPRSILYDNLKSAVLDRVGDAIRFHPEILRLCAYYRFAPKPVAVARGNEKGRVERAIRYIRDNFFAARIFRNLDDLNAQALEWCNGTAASRLHPRERPKTVRMCFQEEQPRLFALPDNPFPVEERREVSVGKTPYIRFDLNDYSVPHTHVRRLLVVLASEQQVRILDQNEVIATHVRSFDARAQIEDQNHIQDLVNEKRHAHQGRGLNRLHHALSSATLLLEEVGRRNGNLSSLTTGLLRLLDVYGNERLEHAIQIALKSGAPHLSAIQQILDVEHAKKQQPVPIAVSLPDHPKVRNAVVKPHTLESYDALTKEPNHED